MRRLNSPAHLAALLALCMLLVACSSTPTYNPTTFPFQLDQARLDAHPIKTVVIAHVNLGVQSRNYLDKEAPRIDSQVASYLKENGFKVLPQRDFEQHWNTAVRAYGNPVDPTSGKLNRNVPAEHPFPSVDTWGFTIHRPFHAVYDSDHRSVYLMVQRNRRHPFLALFDAADPNLSIASRLPTTTPTQTLYLMNSPFVHDQANAMGVRILAAATDDAARVRWAVETTQGRVPSEAEVADAVSFVTAYQSKLAEQKMPTDRQPIVAWSALSRVLLTSNAFLYVD